MIDKILCIGASTYNEGTPEKIDQALSQTNFLDDWTVIIAFHKYLRLYEESQILNQLTTKITQSHFKLSKPILVNQIHSYKLEKGKVYILPDSYYCDQSKQTPIYTVIEENNNEVFIRACNEQKILDDDVIWQQRNASNYNSLLDKYGNKIDIYLPCIDRIMFQIAKTSIEKKAGLILAGIGTDGAEGLANMGKKGGDIAIQCPLECHAKRKPDSDTSEMPNSAIKEAQEHNIQFSFISLNHNTTLIQWLQKIK